MTVTVCNMAWKTPQHWHKTEINKKQSRDRSGRMGGWGWKSKGWWGSCVITANKLQTTTMFTSNRKKIDQRATWWPLSSCEWELPVSGTYITDTTYSNSSSTFLYLQKEHPAITAASGLFLLLHWQHIDILHHSLVWKQHWFRQEAPRGSSIHAEKYPCLLWRTFSGRAASAEPPNFSLVPCLLLAPLL